MNFKIKIALSLAGFSEADIVTIEKALPIVSRLLDATPEIEALFAKIYPDLVAVIPAAKIVINYAKAT